MPGPRLTLVNQIRDTMVAEHEGMKLWPRFSYVRLPHIGSHAGADEAKGAEAPICRIRENCEITA